MSSGAIDLYREDKIYRDVRKPTERGLEKSLKPEVDMDIFYKTIREIDDSITDTVWVNVCNLVHEEMSAL